MSKIGSALLHASRVSDARRQRLERAAEWHKRRTLGEAAESCITAEVPLENRRFDAYSAMRLRSMAEVVTSRAGRENRTNVIVSANSSRQRGDDCCNKPSHASHEI